MPPRSAAIPVVEAQNICFGYGSGLSGTRHRVLDQTSIRVMPGQILGLTGPSGVGKSTLGDVLLGLAPPDSGKVFWEGASVYRKKKFLPRQRRRFFQKIFQAPAASFPPFQTVGQALEDVIAYHGLAKGGPGPERMIADAVLPMGLNSEMLDRHPGQLSGGEMQRFALARITLLSPRFIVADEPTSRLDPAVQALIIRLIADLSRSRNCAVLLISHDEQLLGAVCHRVAHLPPKAEAV